MPFSIFADDESHLVRRCGSAFLVSGMLCALAPKFRTKIQFTSPSMANAISAAFPKMLSEEILSKWTQSESGTLISGALTYFYHMPEGDEDLVIFCFYGASLIFLLRGGNAPERHIHFFSEYHFSKSPAYLAVSNERSIGEHSLEVVRILLGTLGFIKYAQIETKYLPAGQKVKGVECNYKNDTASNVTYIDSKWFTTLVKSDAFKVRGHFRLQPKKKDGAWTKELIWINDFMKEGYTAPARMLNQK